MLEDTREGVEIIARVAALDIGKAELVCCTRVPGRAGIRHRMQEVRTCSTMTRSLLGLADRLAELGVTRVVMEATSDYWKPPFYLLEAAGFETWLVNARDVHHLPGRPKTKALVAVGRSILVIVWHLLTDDQAQFHDLGADFYDTRIGPERRTRNHIRQLEALGYKVTLQAAA